MDLSSREESKWPVTMPLLLKAAIKFDAKMYIAGFKNGTHNGKTYSCSFAAPRLLGRNTYSPRPTAAVLIPTRVRLFRCHRRDFSVT
jgi:hypothetical protein